MTHPSPRPPDDRLRLFGGDDMGRRRGQRSGHLRVEHGSWLLTYRVYDETGRSHRETVRIGPGVGKGKLTEKQAERFAWDHYLSCVDRVATQPKSLMTVGDFWEKHFKPTAPMRLKKTTREQYFSLYARWIEPVIARKRLAILEPGDVERCIARGIEGVLEGEPAELHRISPATGRHIRKVVSAIYTRAKKLRFASGDNPATLADAPPPEPVRQKIALSAAQTAQVLSMLSEPVKTMALTAVLTSANVSELCGLRWKHINLTDAWITVDADGLPPFTIAIRRHWTRGEDATLKTGNRKRNIPMPDPLVAALAKLKQRAFHTGPDDVVFCYEDSGRPINENSTRRWMFAPIAKALKLPRLGWHVFRYSHATFTEAIGMHARDRQALMGHGALEMTDRYTIEDHARMRIGLTKIAGMILPGETVQ